jgi:hypothetical protein
LVFASKTSVLLLLFYLSSCFLDYYVKFYLYFFLGLFIRVLFGFFNIKGFFSLFLGFVFILEFCFLDFFSLGFFENVLLDSPPKINYNFFNKNTSNLLRESIAHTNRSSNVDNSVKDRIRRIFYLIYIKGRKDHYVDFNQFKPS